MSRFLETSTGEQCVTGETAYLAKTTSRQRKGASRVTVTSFLTVTCLFDCRANPDRYGQRGCDLANWWESVWLGIPSDYKAYYRVRSDAVWCFSVRGTELRWNETTNHLTRCTFGDDQHPRARGKTAPCSWLSAHPALDIWSFMTVLRLNRVLNYLTRRSFGDKEVSMGKLFPV